MTEPKRRCSVAGCNRKHGARTLCRKHYRQWQRTGSPIPKVVGGRKTISWDVDPDTGCWNCTSHTPNPKGYVRIRRNGTATYLHRYHYEKINGPIPDGLYVMHACDNPSCINPDHLSVGTPADNVLDAINKGRVAVNTLTVDEVLEIREKDGTLPEVAAEYGVSPRSIRRIRNGETWAAV